MNSDEDEYLIWSIYSSFDSSEQHFNELESKYRLLTSTWLLAMFAGIGYIFTSQGVPESVGRELPICGIALVGALGITLLWNIDLRVYHRLLDAYFVEGLRMERQYDWLPKIRMRMVLSQYESPEHVKPDGGVLKRVKLFYAMSVAVALSIFSLSLFVFALKYSIWVSFGLLLFCILISVSWLVHIYQRTTSPSLGKWLQENRQSALAEVLERDGYVVRARDA